jgi:uncharacterized protein
MILIAIIALVVLIAYFAIGWYFSTKLLVLTPQKVDYDQTVIAVNDTKYTFSGSAYDIDGVVGGVQESKPEVSALFSAPYDIQKDTKTSTRTLIDADKMNPSVDEKIALQGNIWTTDPKQALGLDYQTITYESPSIGTLDAWVVPGNNKTTWTIAVHGIGASKQEMMRFIKPVHDTGSTMMVISYRGDTGNPKPKDGYTRLSDTEWQDLEAAVRYAKSQGATAIQLYGSSLGGSITQNYLRRSADVANTNITKVILDSPALDWGEILAFRVKKMGYPAFISKPGITVASLRAGIHFNRISTKPGSIVHQTLIIHNADDRSVPQAASKRVADAQPDRVTFVDFGTGGHIRAWNHDQQRYEKLVRDFLEQ